MCDFDCFCVSPGYQFIQSGLVTFTSAVSLWQFLQARPIPEKDLSGWSNFASLALRKNVVKGSCRQTVPHMDAVTFLSVPAHKRDK